MDETHQLWSDGITRRKNLTFVKGLCRHLEVKSEASLAKLAGAGWRCGVQCAARSWLQPRTAAPWQGWVRPLLGEWEGGEASQPVVEPHSQRGKWLNVLAF